MLFQSSATRIVCECIRLQKADAKLVHSCGQDLGRRNSPASFFLVRPAFRRRKPASCACNPQSLAGSSARGHHFRFYSLARAYLHPVGKPFGRGPTGHCAAAGLRSEDLRRNSAAVASQLEANHRDRRDGAVGEFCSGGDCRRVPRCRYAAIPPLGRSIPQCRESATQHHLGKSLARALQSVTRISPRWRPRSSRHFWPIDGSPTGDSPCRQHWSRLWYRIHFGGLVEYAADHLVLCSRRSAVYRSANGGPLGGISFRA